MNIDQLKERNIEDIEANSSEVDAMVNRLDSDIARLYCLHHKDPLRFGRLAIQQIGLEIESEAELRAREELYS